MRLTSSIVAIAAISNEGWNLLFFTGISIAPCTLHMNLIRFEARRTRKIDERRKKYLQNSMFAFVYRTCNMFILYRSKTVSHRGVVFLHQIVIYFM